MWLKNETSTVEELKNIKNETAKEYEKIIYTAKKKSDSGMYLYIQIVFMMIMLVTSFILKGSNSATFEYAKENYSQFFEKESYVESTFSYNTFMEKMRLEIQSRYNQLMETFSSITGKGSADIYPSSVSNKKYNLENKGVTPVQGYVSSPYGIRTNPFNSKEKEFHTGIDIAAEKGTFIKQHFREQS